MSSYAERLKIAERVARESPKRRQKHGSQAKALAELREELRAMAEERDNWKALAGKDGNT